MLSSLTIRLLRCFPTVKFHLPDLGEKIKEGTIKKLYVSEGDTIEQFQKIADIASDKQFTELTASDTGVIKKLYYGEEEVCEVGELFMEIEVPSAGASTAAVTKSNEINGSKGTDTSVKAEQKTKTQSDKLDGSLLATPYVRGLIKKHGLEAAKIKGTGEEGRILETDIEAYLALSTDKITTTSKSAQPTPPPSTKAQSQSRSSSAGSTATSSQQIVSMSAFERGMQKSMTQTLTIPHLYLHEEIDVTETERMRKTIKESGRRITLMSIMVKTFSLALKKIPKMNSTYEPNKNTFEYTIHRHHNISLAIDSPNGLVVPNIKNVEDLTLSEIQTEIETLRKLATEAKLTSKDLANGTICLSNIGTIAGVSACPLILAPQVCIVAIGRLQKLPRYFGGTSPVERSIINVSFGCDHRVLDGATVARFCNEWRQLLEDPYLAMVDLR